MGSPYSEPTEEKHSSDTMGVGSDSVLETNVVSNKPKRSYQERKDVEEMQLIMKLHEILKIILD
jgi:hypothetical protein